MNPVIKYVQNTIGLSEIDAIRYLWDYVNNSCEYNSWYILLDDALIRHNCSTFMFWRNSVLLYDKRYYDLSLEVFVSELDLEGDFRNLVKLTLC